MLVLPVAELCSSLGDYIQERDHPEGNAGRDACAPDGCGAVFYRVICLIHKMRSPMAILQKTFVGICSDGAVVA